MFYREKIVSFTLISLCSLLSACTFFPNNDDNHHRTCSELKHQMMFSNGAGAMDQNQAFEDRMQLDKVNESYHDENCI